MNAPKPKARLTAFSVAMALLIAAPLAVVAADQFSDVPDSNVFHDDITWLADAGVTLGCNPPANSQFCPGDNVTREQMAAFMNRLANNQVVRAATAIDADSAASADSINGITVDRFFHQAPPNTNEQVIGTYGPITLYASCDGAGEPELVASWNATVNHITLHGDGPSQFGNATVNAGETIGIGSGPFGSVGLAEAVSFDSNFHTSVEFLLSDAPALGDNLCFFSGFVTIG